MYSCLRSIMCSSSGEYFFLFLCVIGFLKRCSDLIGGIFGPLPYHSAFTKISPSISFSFFISSCFSSFSWFSFSLRCWASESFSSGLYDWSMYFFVTFPFSNATFENGSFYIKGHEHVSDLTCYPGISTVITSITISLKPSTRTNSIFTELGIVKTWT